MKIPFDSLTLMAATGEMSVSLNGGLIQRVMQPGPLDLVLEIRSLGANYRLAISADAAFARAHLTVTKRQNLPEPTAFCMMCRKHLEGGVVKSIRQRDFDRILDVRAERSGQETTLVAELMGKHSNILLVAESGMILDAIKRITHRRSRYRETLPGVTYIPPPEPRKASPFEVTDSDLKDLASISDVDTEALAARLSGRFGGISPFLAEELALRSRGSSLMEAWREIFGAAAAREWLPVVVRSEDGRPLGAYPFPTVQFAAGNQHERAGMSIALDHYYGAAIPRFELDSAAHQLITELDRALKAKESKRQSLLRSLQEAGRAQEYRQAGELILANLNKIDPGAKSVTVEDFYGAESSRMIALDPAKSPKENAEAYFRRYRKARDGAALQREFLEEIESQIPLLAASAESARDASDIAEVRRIRAELASSGALRPESEPVGKQDRRERFQGKKIKTFTTPEGWEILVGENSEANDFLTTRVASPNDLWFHVRASSSAHVVVRTRNAPTSVPPGVLRRAAMLAARNSAAKHSATVPVDYTLKKYVRKPRGAAPGAVTYHHEKTIHVNPKDGESESTDSRGIQ